MYAAAAMPPTSASMSPTKARVDVCTSAPVRTAAPSTAMAMPSQASGAMRAPARRARSAAQTGCVETSAVADATVVKVRLGHPGREVQGEEAARDDGQPALPAAHPP